MKIVTDKDEVLKRESRIKNDMLENCTQLSQQIEQLKQQLSDKVNSGKFYFIIYRWHDIIMNVNS